MNLKAHLIYKSSNTCFSTLLPVYFYGMSSGKIGVLLSQFKNDNPFDTTQEWVVAIHNDFLYDFETDTILTANWEEVGIDEFMELADDLEQNITAIKAFGHFYSNNEAQQYFYANAHYMLESLKPYSEKANLYLTDWQM